MRNVHGWKRDGEGCCPGLGGQDLGEERLQGQALSEDAGHAMAASWLDTDSRYKCLLHLGRVSIGLINRRKLTLLL